MPINLNQTNLDITDPNLQEVWGNLQGNIVKSHGRDHSRHVFLKFTGDSKECRQWLKKFSAQITSALEQNRTARAFHASGKEELFTGVQLSYKGYKALKIKASAIPADKAFRVGMKDTKFKYDTVPRGDHNPTANPLKDDIDDWEKEFQEDIHATIILAYGGRTADDEGCTKVLDKEVRRIKRSLKGIAEVILVQAGHAMRNKLGQVIEHFGYNDGVSDPLFMKPDLDKARENGGLDRFDPAAPVGIILVQDPGGKSKTEAYGSYCVHRKLQQNIRGFHDKVGELAQALSENSGKDVDDGMAGALVIGRFRDGTPVGEQANDGWTNLFNNFDFKHDPNGLRCPFQSHIRKTNPRGDTAQQFGSPLTIESSRRIVRRGISYGSTELNPKKEWTDAGLLFVSFQSDIEQQFIFMQNTWCNNENFVRPETGLDPVIGETPKGQCPMTQKWPTQWGVPSEPTEFAFSSVIRTRGGEYFFAPSLSFFETL